MPVTPYIELKTIYNNLVSTISSPGIGYKYASITYCPTNDFFYWIDGQNLYKAKNSNQIILLNNNLPLNGTGIFAAFLKVAVDGTLYMWDLDTTYSIYVSTDEGVTWTQKSIPGPSFGNFSDRYARFFRLCPITNKLFFFCPTNPATNNNVINIHVSSDRGSTWTNIYSESSGSYNYNTDYFAVSNYVVKDKGFFVTFTNENSPNPPSSNKLMFVQTNPTVSVGAITNWGSPIGRGFGPSNFGFFNFFLLYNNVSGYQLVDDATQPAQFMGLGSYYEAELYDENNNACGYSGARFPGRYRIWQA